MKIGIDARMLRATGIGRYVSNLILELGNIDRQNQYVLFLKKDDFNSFYSPAKNFKKVIADFHWYTLDEQIKFSAIIKAQNLDLMHFPHFNVPYFYNEPFLITIHDLTLHRHKTIRASTKNIFIYNFKHLVYKKLIRHAARKALKIFTPSEFTKKEVMKILKIPAQKIVVTKEGAAGGKLLDAKADKTVLQKFKIKKPYLLYIGNSYPHKNLSRLIKALKLLPKEIGLVLVGKTDEFYQGLKKEIMQAKLEKRIVLTGYLTDEQIIALYENATAFVFPSLCEGFGLPGLEAMTFGLPVVASNSSCLPEILGKAALYFDPYDTDDIADKIAQVLKDRDLRKRLIKKGKGQVSKYSWNKCAEETLKVYNEIKSGV